MASIPVPQSYNQILGGMIDGYLSKVPLKRLKVGSPVLCFLETAAQSDLRVSQDIFGLLKSSSLDNATGDALDRLGADEGLTRIVQSKSSGAVNVIDSSFTKISTNIYQGTAAPIIGSASINVSNASLFPTSGSLYIGRNTSNYEGPLSYTATVNNGTYWTITLGVSSNTQKFHNLGETVILAQGGNRQILGGSLCQTPQGNANSAIQFQVLNTATVPDGETEVDGIVIVASAPGLTGNAPAGAINSFVTPPFTGATVTNPLPLTNATATEDDPTFRDRIRVFRASKTQGTSLALTSGVIGVISTQENKHVSSSSYVAPQGATPTLYIDDGTGYQEISTGVAIEAMVDQALGGEQFFSIASAPPVAKAFVKTTLTAPFMLTSGSKLAVYVGGVLYEHTFSSTSFVAIGNATAFEVASSINSDFAMAFNARASDSGTTVTIFAKADTNENINVVSASSINATDTDANIALGFPTGTVYSMRLYKNDLLLSKDGQIATLTSRPLSSWGILNGAGESLIVNVDGTGAVTYNFTAQDFINAGTGFVTLTTNTLAAWAAVFNNRLAGITTTVSGSVLTLVSNLGTNSRASLNITGGSLIGKIFVASSSSGANSDYTLSRNWGQIKLQVPLSAGDSLAAGSLSTRAFVQSGILSPLNVLAAGGANIWLVVDGEALIIQTGVTTGTPLDITVSALEYWGTRIRIASHIGSTLFSNVKLGDWIIAWDTGLVAANQGMFRVTGVDPGFTWVEIERQSMTASRQNGTATLLGNGNVLIIGGQNTFNGDVLDTVEIWNPTTNQSTPAASYPLQIYLHTATLLNNSTVLVCGGLTGLNVPTNLAYIYTVGSNTWAATGNMPEARYGHTASLITAGANSGSVIVVGGVGASATFLSNLPVFTTNSFANSGTTLNQVRWQHQTTMLSNSDFLVHGGVPDLNNSTASLTSTETINHVTYATAVTGSLNTARQGHRSVLLNNGKVLATGGKSSTNGSALLSTELFTSPTWATATPMNTARLSHAIGLFTSDNTVAVTGGTVLAATNQTEIYNSTIPSWTGTTQPLLLGRQNPMYAVVSSTTLAIAGGFAIAGGRSFAAFELLTHGSPDTWTAATAATPILNTLLTNGGMVFVRTDAQIQKVNIPQLNNYTATSLSPIISAGLFGAAATVFRTNQLRVNTNTYGVEGDIAVVAADVDGQKLLLPISSFVANLSSHISSIQSGNPDLGTPTFIGLNLDSAQSTTQAEFDLDSNSINSANGLHSVFLSGDSVVGLKNLSSVSATFLPRMSENQGYFSTALTQTLLPGSQATLITLRRPANTGFIPNDRFYEASHFSIAPVDTLTLVLDGDTVSRRFAINMYRRLIPKAASSYGSTLTLQDLDNGHQSLAFAFGVSPNGFDFTDFALYMKARTVSDQSTVKSVLWRYTIFGPDGNLAQIRYTYPPTPNTSLAVIVDDRGAIASIAGGLTSTNVNISVQLPSGAVRSPLGIRNTTNVGLSIVGPAGGGLYTYSYVFGLSVSSATRNTNVTTLTLTLPPGITDHGLANTNIIWLQSSNVNYTSGLYTITGRTPTTVSYTDNNANHGPDASIGDISYDIAEATIAGSGTSTGDVFTFDTTTSLPAAFTTKTLSIFSGTFFGNQFVQGYSDSKTGTGGAVGTVSSVLSWSPIGLASGFKIYPLNAAQCTTSAIATSVNALAAVVSSACPVTAVATGAGGTVTQSLSDQLQVAFSFYQFSDGINYIQSEVVPGTTAGDFTFTLKDPTNANLTTNNDFNNEEMRIAPIQAASLSRWLNSTAVTGLGTNGAIKTATQNHFLQIATNTPGSVGSVVVQGGTANSLSIPVQDTAISIPTTGVNNCMACAVRTSDAVGLNANTYVALQNVNPQPRNVLTATTVLQSITIDPGGTTATFVLSGTNAWTQTSTGSYTLQVEKQGKFMCYLFDNPNSGGNPFVAINEADYIYVQTVAQTQPLSSVNTGLFRVVRVDSTNSAIYVENPNGIEEGLGSGATIVSFANDGILPGDVLHINSPAWGGVGNQGNWVIVEVGGVTAGSTQYLNQAYFRVAIPPGVILTPVTSPQPALGTTNAALIRVYEGAASRLIKYVISTCPNQVTGLQTDLKFNTDKGFTKVGIAAGTLVQSLDKLAFPTTLANGIDGYAHSTGLIAAVVQTAYGDPQDTATFPGIIAAGATVDVSGPIIRRIQVSLSLRINTSTANTIDVQNQVQSAVATVINNTGIGEAIALSDIITAAEKVNGVTSVTIVSPIYSVGNDLISIQPFEKPMVLNLAQDVTVSFVGS